MGGGVENGWWCRKWVVVSKMGGGVKNGWWCQKRVVVSKTGGGILKKWAHGRKWMGVGGGS
jgi:hypothetical protein